MEGNLNMNNDEEFQIAGIKTIPVSISTWEELCRIHEPLRRLIVPDDFQLTLKSSSNDSEPVQYSESSIRLFEDLKRKADLNRKQPSIK